MITINGKYTTANIMIDDIEPECLSQISKFVNHEAFTNPISIMPDTHAGLGSVIGFTMPLTDKVIPNVIGVDIGCGMTAVKLKNCPVVVNANPSKTTINGMTVADLNNSIRDRIPMGFSLHKTAQDIPMTVFKTAQNIARKFMNNYLTKYGVDISKHYIYYDQKWLKEKCVQVGESFNRVLQSIGTLGGGNHFIELGLDDNLEPWVVVHSGSRHFGLTICKYWQNQAYENHLASEPMLKSQIDEIRNNAKTQEDRKLIASKIQELRDSKRYKGPKELAYLDGASAFEYLFDMLFAQVYAEYNRMMMRDSILNILNIQAEKVIVSTHNYIDFTDMIVRKGAIRSYENEEIIIPFNMKDGVLICEGSSNPEWNYSAPHGAGRVLSRSKAKSTLSLDEFQDQMKEIHSTSVCPSTLDEAPNAYKDSEIIESAIQPTCTIKYRIKPILNIKAL